MKAPLPSVPPQSWRHRSQRDAGVTEKLKSEETQWLGTGL